MCSTDWKTAPGQTVVCYCKNVDKQTIVSAIQSGADSLRQIRKMTKACTGNRCKQLNPSGRCCRQDIVELLKLYGNKPDISCDCCNLS